MKNTLLALAVLCGALPLTASVADSDLGYGAYGVSTRRQTRPSDVVYRPKQRYFGKGYIVTYTYFPQRAGALNAQYTGFRTTIYDIDGTSTKTRALDTNAGMRLTMNRNAAPAPKMKPLNPLTETLPAVAEPPSKK